MIPIGFLNIFHKYSVINDPGKEFGWNLGWDRGGVNAGNLAEQLAIYTGVWQGSFDGITNEEYQLVGCIATLHIGGGIISAEVTDPVPGNDGGSGTGQPPQVAYLVRKLSDLGGRTNMGRAYLPGVDNNRISASGALVTTEIDNINDEFAAFPAAIGGATDLAEPVIFHVSSSDPTVITSFVCEPVVATQRRRVNR